MSTRCQIGFYESSAGPLDKPFCLVYKHCDGYPEGTLPIIEKFCKLFDERRGMHDTEYASAWFVYYLVAEHTRHMKRLHKQYAKEGMCGAHLPKDGMDGLGHGICRDFHWDIEYYYRVNPDAILVYDVCSAESRGWKLLKTVKFARIRKAA